MKSKKDFIIMKRNEKKSLRRKVVAPYIMKLGPIGLTIVEIQSAFESTINYN